MIVAHFTVRAHSTQIQSLSLTVSSTSLSYREAGVDIDAGERLVEAIKPFAKRTLRPEVLAGIGGFGALIELPKRYREPVTSRCTTWTGAAAAGSRRTVSFHREAATLVTVSGRCGTPLRRARRPARGSPCWHAVARSTSTEDASRKATP